MSSSASGGRVRFQFQLTAWLLRGDGRSSIAPVTDCRRRGPEEQKVYEALAVLRHGERLEVLRDAPLARSVKLGGASVIAHRARQAGVLGKVLAVLRSHQQ